MKDDNPVIGTALTGTDENGVCTVELNPLGIMMALSGELGPIPGIPAPGTVEIVEDGAGNVRVRGCFEKERV